MAQLRVKSEFYRPPRLNMNQRDSNLGFKRTKNNIQRYLKIYILGDRLHTCMGLRNHTFKLNFRHFKKLAEGYEKNFDDRKKSVKNLI